MKSVKSFAQGSWKSLVSFLHIEWQLDLHNWAKEASEILTFVSLWRREKCGTTNLLLLSEFDNQIQLQTVLRGPGAVILALLGVCIRNRSPEPHWPTSWQNLAQHSRFAVEEVFPCYRQLLGMSRWGSSYHSVWHLSCNVAAYEPRNPVIKCISVWQDAVTFLCFSAN